MTKNDLITEILKMQDGLEEKHSPDILKGLNKVNLQKIYSDLKSDEQKSDVKDLPLRDRLCLVFIDLLQASSLFSFSPFATHTFNSYKKDLKTFYNDQSCSWVRRLYIEESLDPDFTSISLKSFRSNTAWTFKKLRDYDTSMTSVMESYLDYCKAYLETFPNDNLQSYVEEFYSILKE